MFNTNVGLPDRIARIALGVALVLAAPVNPWGWLGFLPLATGLTGKCPVYTLLGVRTCKAE